MPIKKTYLFIFLIALSFGLLSFASADVILLSVPGVKTLGAGENWKVGAGYALEAWIIDAKAVPRQGGFILRKNGATVDEIILTEGQTYSFKGYPPGQTLFTTKLSSIFAAQVSDMAQFTETYLSPSAVASCAQNWQCTPWSQCENGKQHRACIDANDCGSGANMPADSQDCASQTLAVGGAWKAGGGFLFEAAMIDARAKQGWFKLYKDGALVDDKIVTEGQTFGYNDWTLKITAFSVKVDSIWAAQVSDMVKLTNLYILNSYLNSCVKDWQCFDWSRVCTIDGLQVRSCWDNNNCGDLSGKPSTSQNCEVVNSCTENWQCSAWSNCVNNSQTRACNDLNNCGTVNSKPAITQSCVSNPCVENWSCGDWSSCVNSQQSRSCADLNSCGTANNKPSITLRCVSNPCVETWSCGVWSNCVNNSQTRVCADINNCGTSIVMPSLWKICTSPSPSSPSPSQPSQQQNANCPALKAGDLFKVPDNSAVYIINNDSRRLYFPNSEVYHTWYQTFSTVQTILNVCVDDYPAPGKPPYGVNFRSGSRLVKREISPYVYAVLPNNQLSKIGSPEVAKELYGANWTKLVRDISDVFWINYNISNSIIDKAAPHNGMFVKQADSDFVVYFVKDGLLHRLENIIFSEDVRVLSKSVFEELNKAGTSIASQKAVGNPVEQVLKL